MCHPVLCRICAKVTWSGCGEHVDQALAGVPPQMRCDGHDPVQSGAPEAAPR